MTETRRCDAIIIGTGQAGKPLAVALARAGWSVAVVERDAVGGSCVNFGCTPTKTMVASARVAQLARDAERWGVRVGDVEVDLERVRDRKRRMVERFSAGVEHSLEEPPGIDLVRGHGRFSGPRQVDVELGNGAGSLRLVAERGVFINTGTRSRVPDLPGLDRIPFLDNRSIMELATVPARLLVLGGGYIGLEFAQMFRRFGAEVAIVHRGPQLLAREDPDVAAEVRRILEEDGIEVLVNAEARRLEGEPGNLRLEVETAGERRRLEGSHLLLAVGRTPNSDDLGLAAAGVETDEAGFVRVDDRLRTSAEHVYALGDVKGGPAFTHISYDDFRILRRNVLEGGDATTSGRLVPYTVFLDPELGRVGMTESEARASGRRIRVARLPMNRVARALEMGETRGFMKAIVDEASGEILGCAILGVYGGEVMSVLETAMMGGLPYTAIEEAIFAHPTFAESLNNMFATLRGP